MPSYLNLTASERQDELERIESLYSTLLQTPRSLNMTRGKPCADQLDLSAGLLTAHDHEQDWIASDGTDCRNYGGLDGLPEARQLFSELLGFRPDQIMVLGNSSLNIMYDLMIRAMLFPLPGATTAWAAFEKRKFLCPVPGYDRHFAITEQLGFEMVPVAMNEDGPDMDQVETLVAADPDIKGIWLVPVYSNPQGYTCSDTTCRRLAAMQTAAPDFRIFWDNAYFTHHLDFDRPSSVPNILELCQQAGVPDRVFAVASTSKVTWAGAGIACLAASPANLDYIRRELTIQTIGHDKMNQLRHVRFLRDAEHVDQLMRRHAGILRPKFDLADQIMNEALDGLDICRWTKPSGGYFISLDVLPGIARQVVSLAKACGVALTPAGSTWPNGIDPYDSSLRLAPSFPPLEELEQAMRVLTVCIRLAALRHLTNHVS